MVEKLKTIKDIAQDGRWELVPLKELKAEAIKWVKEDRELIFGKKGKELTDQQCLKIIMKRWEERFNLTEEDLK